MNDMDGTSLVDELADALQAMVRWSQTLTDTPPSPSVARSAESALSAYYGFQSGEEDDRTVSPIESEREV